MIVQPARRRSRLSRLKLNPLKVGVWAFFIFFLVIPVFSIFVVSLVGELINVYGAMTNGVRFVETMNLILEKATFQHYVEIFSEPRYAKAIWNSLWLAALVTTVAMVLVAPVAYGLARTAMWGKKLLGALLLIPVIMPTFVAGYGFTLMFGRTGWVQQFFIRMGGEGQIIDLRSWVAIFLVQVFLFFPYALLPMVVAFRSMDASIEEAAQSLGASRWLSLFNVTLPLALPGLAASGLLMFVITFSDFGAPVVLAPKQFPLIPVEAFREATGYFNWGGSSVLVCTMILVASLSLYLNRRLLKKGNFETISGKGVRRELQSSPVLCWSLSAYSLLFLTVPLLMIGSVAIQSFATTWGRNPLPDGYTLDNYREVFHSFSWSITNSILLGLGALVVSVVFAVGAAYLGHRYGSVTLDFIANVPLAIPGVALGIALITAFNLPPLKLQGTAVLLIVAYALRRLPHMIRTTTASLMAIKREQEEAALSLGATPFLMAWSVVIPLVMPGIIAGGILVLVTVIREISITVLLTPGKWAPLSLAVYQFLQRGEFYIASALAMVMVAIVLVLQYIAQRLAGDKALF